MSEVSEGGSEIFRHEALEALLDEFEVTELIDPARPSVVPKRRGLFRRR